MSLDDSSGVSGGHLFEEVHLGLTAECSLSLSRSTLQKQPLSGIPCRELHPCFLCSAPASRSRAGPCSLSGLPRLPTEGQGGAGGHPGAAFQGGARPTPVSTSSTQTLCRAPTDGEGQAAQRRARWPGDHCKGTTPPSRVPLRRGRRRMWAAAPSGQELSWVWERYHPLGLSWPCGQCLNSHLGKQAWIATEAPGTFPGTQRRGTATPWWSPHCGRTLRPPTGPSLSFEASASTPRPVSCLSLKGPLPSWVCQCLWRPVSEAGLTHLTAFHPGKFPGLPNLPVQLSGQCLGATCFGRQCSLRGTAEHSSRGSRAGFLSVGPQSTQFCPLHFVKPSREGQDKC